MDSTPFKYFSLRLPMDLHAWLKAQAEKHRRSMSAELLCQLEELMNTTAK